ncbi:MAG: vWA domain-containing protein [Actinomycetota bacterium]
MSPRFRYSRWDGTQDPWADPDEVLEGLSDDLLEFGDLGQALRRMMQRGFSIEGRRITGLQSLSERLRNMRRDSMRRYDMDSVVGQISDELREVRELERHEVSDRLDLRRRERGEASTPLREAAPDLDALPDDDPLSALEREFAEPPFGSRLDPRLDYLDHLEGRPADALKGLQNYDFLSPEAEAKFQELTDRLRQQVLQQYFRGAEQALQNMTPEELQRMKDMLSELNEMVRKHNADEPYDFDGFMQRYGDFFPEDPKNLEELLETLARRMAMAQAMMSSMSPEMRQRLEDLVGSLLQDTDLAYQMNELSRMLRQAMPGDFWDQSYPFGGEEPLDMLQAMQVMERIQESEDLERYMRGVSRPSDLDEVDLERVSNLLGDEAARDVRRLREIEKMLEEAGYVERKSGRLDLTPHGVRRIGKQALGKVYQRLRAALAGEHDQPEVGRGGDITGDLKQYEFGDPFHIEVKETVFEAVRRSGTGTPVTISPDDFMIERTERKVQAATALLIDLSLSMPMRGNWVAAKKVALALHALISSQFPRDRLFLVGFSDYARRIQPEELPNLGWEEVYGTNMQHALLLARRLLGRHRGASRQILMVTDGEPTAHLLPNGEVLFNWPPIPQTFEETLKEVARCSKDGIVINTFMLDRSPYLMRFIERMTALNRGRAFFTSPEHLGEYVLLDFLESKRAMLQGA